MEYANRRVTSILLLDARYRNMGFFQNHTYTHMYFLDDCNRISTDQGISDTGGQTNTSIILAY